MDPYQFVRSSPLDGVDPEGLADVFPQGGDPKWTNPPLDPDAWGPVMTLVDADGNLRVFQWKSPPSLAPFQFDLPQTNVRAAADAVLNDLLSDRGTMNVYDTLMARFYSSCPSRSQLDRVENLVHNDLANPNWKIRQAAEDELNKMLVDCPDLQDDIWKAFRDRFGGELKAGDKDSFGLDAEGHINNAIRDFEHNPWGLPQHSSKAKD
jgi:hypothetical protein